MIYLNSVPINVTIFPDKTSQVWKIENLDFNKGCIIKWDFENESEFMHLAQLVDLLNKCYPILDRHLILSYLPYARQDKEISNNSCFALHTFTELLNSLGFASVKILDPHSVEYLKIDNADAIFSIAEIKKIITDLNIDLVFYPDKGALIRYSNIYSFKIPCYSATKVRDHLSGNITGMNISIDKTDLQGKRVLILDDICDGGMTFILLAKELQRLDVKNISLFVTHGIFSKGTQVLRDAGINRIFTSKGEIK